MYLINNVVTYRVGTVDEVLKLREKLEKDVGELVSFSYTTKYIKDHGEIVEEYQVVKAKVVFNLEKEPESSISITYNYKDNFGGYDE